MRVAQVDDVHEARFDSAVTDLVRPEERVAANEELLEKV
jgi:hypothetical protein